MVSLPSFSTIGLGAKIAGCFGSIWVRVVVVLVAVALLAFSAHLLVNAFQKHEQELYKNGYAAGAAATNASWQAASARNAQQQVAAVVQQSKAQSQSVQEYLADKDAEAPKIQVVKEETIRYAQTPDGSTRCLDDGGVQLLEDERAALGIVGPPATGAPASGGVRGGVQHPSAAPVQH